MTGFRDNSGERYDRFGSNDPALEGYFDLAGLEFPQGDTSAQYQISVETLDPACADFAAVGPYRGGQVAPSGTAATVTLTLNQGDDVIHDFVMSGSVLPASESGGTFSAPARLPTGGNWAGALSPYGNVDYYSLAARSDRTITVKVTALNEAGKASENKAQPVIGIWPDTAGAGSLPDVAVFHFNSTDSGATALNARFLESGNFKLGIADFRGDGRPDFRYRGRVFYGDSVTPWRVAAQSGTALTVRGIGLNAATAATVNGRDLRVIAAFSDRIVLTAPNLSDGTYNVDLQAPDGATSSLINALTYGAVSSDQIVLLQGAGNPSTPVGGEALNPLRVRVVEADGISPVSGASVRLSASPAGVLFSACNAPTCSLLTDEQGEAVTRLVPTAVGTFTATAAISPTTYVHADVTGFSSALAISALSQSAWVAQGGSGSLALNVRVLSSGQPVAGRTVQYAVTQGVASLSSTTAVSNASGYASVNLNLSSVQGEVHASACVMPGAAPCCNINVFMIPVSEMRLQFVAGEQQIINTAQAFYPVTLRVTDSESPPDPVQMAPVTVLSAVMRWQLPPVAAGQNPLPPSAPVVLSSGRRVVYSDANGLVSILPVADARLGAVVVKMIGVADTGLPLQFEVQRLWAPPGFAASDTTLQKPFAGYQRSPRQRRSISSPRYQPTE